MHRHIHTPPHTHIHTTHTRTHTHTRTCTYTHARTHARRHARTHTLAHILAYYKRTIHACMPVHAVTDAPILLHARMHMLFRHTFTWKWTHTHSFAYMIAYWHRAVHIGRDVLARICMHSCAHTNMNNMNTHVGEWDGEGGKQVGSMNEESQVTGPRSAVVSASDCGSEGLGFESHQSHVGFFSPGRLLPRAGSAMGPVGRLEPHSRASSTSLMRLWGCCSNYLTNTALLDQHCRCRSSRAWLTPG